MLFNSLDFLIFFPIVVAIYFVVPRRLRHVWLLIVSYYYYMSWNPRSAVALVVSTVVTYVAARLVHRYAGQKRMQILWLVISLVLNLSILSVFKYDEFILENVNHVLSAVGLRVINRGLDLITPVGISFYTFKVISYTIDVYRGRIEPECNILRYALYVSFFPQIVSGPIERAGNLLPQIRDIDKASLWNYDRVRDGLVLMMWGLFQKLMIADRAALLVNTVIGDYTSYGFLEIAIAATLYTIQIYCDFDGYTNMARGAAQVLGFDTMRNFRQPYLATSIKEFWRRWHISLTSWFTDYLYIPLGGNRKGILRKYINILIVFGLSGLWHGSAWNFIAWGLLHAIYQIADDMKVQFCKRRRVAMENNHGAIRILRTVVTFVLVDFAWIFFRCGSLKEALGVIRQMSTAFQMQGLLNLGLNQGNWFLLIVSIIILLVVDILHERGISIFEIFHRQSIWVRMLICLALVWTVLMLGIYGEAYSTSGFIYTRF